METIDLSPLKQLTNLFSLEISYNALKEIDLSGLENCTSLGRLKIDYNGGLKEIDLQPLRNCINLTHLSIAHSNIHKLDLEPIRNCKKLRTLELLKNSLKELILFIFPNIYYLSLGWNRLQNIDLTPLGKCPQLQFLDLRNNLLFHIDLTPLKFCPELRAIWLEKTKLSSIEISPLFHYYSIEEFCIDDDVRLIADPDFQTKIFPKGFLKYKNCINWIKHPSEIEPHHEVQPLKGVVVFMSGRLHGHEEERDAIAKLLEEWGAIVNRFEMVATSQNPNDQCRNWAQSCDLYLGIFGGSYGEVTENGLSPTEIEFNEARIGGKDIIILIKHESIKDEQARFIKKIRDWNDGVIAPYYQSQDDLIFKITKSLENLFTERFMKRRFP